MSLGLTPTLGGIYDWLGPGFNLGHGSLQMPLSGHHIDRTVSAVLGAVCWEPQEDGLWPCLSYLALGHKSLSEGERVAATARRSSSGTVLIIKW